MFEFEIKREQGGNGEDVKIKMDPDYSSQSPNSAVNVKDGLVNGFAGEDISLMNVRQNEAEGVAPVDKEEREDCPQSAAVYVKVEYGDSDEEDAAPDSESGNGGRGEDVQQETVVGDMEDSSEETPKTKPNLAGVDSSVMTMYKNLLDRGNSRKRGAKRHACQFCQRVFTKNSLLDIHSRTHTGEKPYKCKFCERRFVQNSNLQTHLKTHTGETPFQCSLCPCRFAVKCNLQRHLKSHTGEKPYECDVCHRRFTQKENLLAHLRTHTAEKPFQCAQCRARFRQRGVLARHLRTHTGERPYPCHVCRQRFRQHSHLLRHTNIHNRKEKEKRAKITTPP